MNNNKYICIHGHFYQPPRENAWLEVIEKQDSATPFHDWNERINFECYAPNAMARILDRNEHIINIINNYARISFNFGPTLLSWLAEKDPATYQAILQADKMSQERFGGHGSAMAQVHGHLIMPLANRRDKETQIIWGIEDFKSRFGRQPEGIWLAETAVDTETLKLLVDHDIKFTVLAPRQGKAMRQIGQQHWHQLGHAAIDPRRPYQYNLPSGRSIALFFYDGNVSQAVAFENILRSGKAYAHRIINTLDKHNDYPQLAHVATDGESYGHHHRHGEMALADCLNYIETKSLGTLTNYGEYLELFPPDHEVLIHENSSWSCVHGVERWRSDCGCHTGGKEGWNQAWRKPLRDLLNWLRDEILPIYEEKGALFLKDIWAARNAYIQILLDRSEENIEAFFNKYAIKALSSDEKTTVLRLMEMQRHSMLMFTSCAWFFNEISGIETDQVLQYANRAIHYAKQLSGLDLHDEFIHRLEQVPSNVNKNGAVNYKKNIIPTRVDLLRVGMHYAASSLFTEYEKEHEFFNYITEKETFERIPAGLYSLTFGRTKVKSKVTHSEKLFSFAVLYLGQQNMIGHISLDMSLEEFEAVRQKLKSSFKTTNLGRTIIDMEECFGSEHFTIWHLFRDEKRRILEIISKQGQKDAQRALRNIYEDNYQLMLGMLNSNIPLPKTFLNLLEYIINQDLYRFFSRSILKVSKLNQLIEEIKKWNLTITDTTSLKRTIEDRLFWEIQKHVDPTTPVEELEHLIQIIDATQPLGIDLNFWQGQNIYFSTLKMLKNKQQVFPSKAWRRAFMALGERLKVKGIY